MFNSNPFNFVIRRTPAPVRDVEMNQGDASQDEEMEDASKPLTPNPPRQIPLQPLVTATQQAVSFPAATTQQAFQRRGRDDLPDQEPPGQSRTITCSENVSMTSNHPRQVPLQPPATATQQAVSFPAATTRQTLQRRRVRDDSPEQEQEPPRQPRTITRSENGAVKKVLLVEQNSLQMTAKVKTQETQITELGSKLTNSNSLARQMQKKLSQTQEQLDNAHRRAVVAAKANVELTVVKEQLNAAQQRAAAAEQMAIKLADAEQKTNAAAAVAEQMKAQLDSAKLRLDAAEQRAAAAEQMETQLTSARKQLDEHQEQMKMKIFAFKTQLHAAEQEREALTTDFADQIRAAGERAAFAEQELANSKNRAAIAEQRVQQVDPTAQNADRDGSVGDREVGASRDKGKGRDLGGDGKASGNGNGQRSNPLYVFPPRRARGAGPLVHSDIHTAPLQSEEYGADESPHGASNDQQSRNPYIPPPMKYARPRGGAGPLLRFKPMGHELSEDRETLGRRHDQQANPFSRQQEMTGPSLRFRDPHFLPSEDPDEDAPSIPNDSQPQSLEAKMDALLLEVVGIKKRLQPGNPYRGRDRTTRYVKPHRFKPAPIRNREVVRTKQLAIVRERMNALLHIKQDSDIALDDTEPSPDVLSAYENDGIEPGPELDPMVPYWDELKSKWNDRLCDLFIRHLKDDDVLGVTSDDEPTITEMFHARLKRLKRERVEMSLREGEGQQEGRVRIYQTKLGKLNRQRPNSRRATLFALRTDITLGNLCGSGGLIDPGWNALNVVVDHLGAAGMSSDESEDDESGRRIYVVNKTIWRDRRVTASLRLVDGDHNRTNGFGNRKAGNPARTRITRARARESAREAPPGLPTNFYDPTWYAGLTNRERNELGALPEFELPEVEG